MRYTTKTANAYLNQYGLEVLKNTTTTKHNQNQMYLGYWYVIGTSEQGKRYTLCYASTLTEVMEQARWHLLEGRPQTAIELGEASCELPLVESPETEDDIHTQNLEAGFCYQTMPSGVVYVYDPQGNCHIATDIDTADECIRDGVWNCGQQCPIEIHYSPIDDCGYQNIVITELMVPVLEADEDGIVFMPAYLTEAEYEDTKHLMEF